MDRNWINRIILFFVLGMGLYHIIPSEFLIGRLIYYISLYGSITSFLFYLRYASLEKKDKRFYLYASFYSIGKMFYHLYVAIFKYRYFQLKMEYNFSILGIECELFISIFTGILLISLLLIKYNNRDG